jgi:hypothetical protein
MMIKFNKEQREGFARACDTVAVTSVVGAAVAITGHSQLQIVEICGLIAITPMLFAFGCYLRSSA